MFSFNHFNKSLTLLTLNIITTSSIYQLYNSSRQKIRRQIFTTLITTTSLLSNNTSLSISTSTTQNQQITFDEPYSAKTGIKTAALLGGMLLFAVVYLSWKARSRLCRFTRFRSSNRGTSTLSSTKFDLDYWLKQVDLLEAKEAERIRGHLSPYLELPNEQPRNNELATATWITDAWRQRRLIQYQQQRPVLQQRTLNQPVEANSLLYRRRHRVIQRLTRRFRLLSRQRPSFLIEYSPSLIADMRPSIVNNTLIPPPHILDIPPRRVASWPRLKSSHHQNDTVTSALQIHNARKRLLKRTSQTTSFEI